ncbi:MAG TPA: hypothetical protein VGQ79_02530 [Nitrospiraceae bacterium]|jgi:hypothetical protein|nr:hypothetical protein [Nitrospiraceae bacterium]
MTEKFHERFNIPVSAEDARKRFVNRVYNDILIDFFYNFLMQEQWDVVSMRVLTALGIKNQASPAYFQWENKIGDDFWTNVRAAEAMYESVSHMGVSLSLVKIIENILHLSEVDLGIRWHEGHFLPSGSPLLDEKLVNDVLRCLQPNGYAGVRASFIKGLEHLLHSIGKPQLRSDVVTDMYEALEALAKIVTGRNKELSANAEQFISMVKVSDGYKRLLKEYIAYANAIRHAGKEGQAKPDLTRKEVESFVYLTGVFIRLAVSEEAQA